MCGCLPYKIGAKGLCIVSFHNKIYLISRNSILATGIFLFLLSPGRAPFLSQLGFFRRPLLCVCSRMRKIESLPSLSQWYLLCVYFPRLLLERPLSILILVWVSDIFNTDNKCAAKFFYWPPQNRPWLLDLLWVQEEEEVKYWHAISRLSRRSATTKRLFFYADVTSTDEMI